MIAKLLKIAEVVVFSMFWGMLPIGGSAMFGYYGEVPLFVGVALGSFCAGFLSCVHAYGLRNFTL